MSPICIATPNSGTMTADYVSSILGGTKYLMSKSIDWMFLQMTSGNFIDRIRNALIRSFLLDKECKDCDYLLFIDSDIGFNHTAIYDILQHKQDIVGGAVKPKNDTEDFKISIECDDMGRPLCNRDGLIKAKMVGTAFLKISRACLDRMWYEQGDKDTYDYMGKIHKPLFETNIHMGAYWGEDTTFCRKWRELGGELWVYPNIDFSHTGLKSWESNLHKYLLSFPDKQKEEQLNFGNIRKITEHISNLQEA
jgi:hypothetical protein